EQQIRAFESKGTFPSQVEALEASALLDSTDEFFNGAPTGEILANRAAAVEVTPFKGANYFAIHQSVQDAITRVDVSGTDDPDSSWEKALTAFAELGLWAPAGAGHSLPGPGPSPPTSETVRGSCRH